MSEGGDTESLYRQVYPCRLCQHQPTVLIVDYGSHPLAEFVDPASEAEVQKAPLLLVGCPACGLVQLRDSVDPKILYRHQYWYESGMNKTMRAHLEDLARSVHTAADLKQSDITVDIGCNDGTMLAAYPEGPILVGFEPGKELSEKALTAIGGRGYIFNSFWSANEYTDFIGEKVKAITAIAMFYDLEDPQTFLNDMSAVMTDDGVAVIQMNDLAAMLENNAYDIVGHEHLTYWPFATFEAAAKAAGLEIFHVERFDLNGGTIRFWLGRPEVTFVQPSVSDERQRQEQLFSEDVWEQFDLKTTAESLKLKKIIAHENEMGGRVYLYGASTRGQTIIQRVRIRKEDVAGVAEIHPGKIGKIMAGSGIPIVSEEEARKDATMFVVLPYSYRKEFVEREAEFVACGGTLVFPLPEVDVVVR